MEACSMKYGDKYLGYQKEGYKVFWGNTSTGWEIFCEENLVKQVACTNENNEKIAMIDALEIAIDYVDCQIT